MGKLERISPFRLSSLLRLQKDPKLAFQLFLNPNPNYPNPSSKPFRYSLLSYDLIICQLGRAKMFDKMEKIIEQLRNDTRVLPKEVIFCNIISFYGRALLHQKALQMFDQIPSFRCQRTIKSVNTLLNSLLMCRKFDKMMGVARGIEKYGCPDVYTYNILINACCVLRDLGNAWDVFDEMRKRGVQPNVVTFGTLINGLCAKSELDEAFKLKKMMERDFKLRPNAFVYVALIKGLCKGNEVDSAIKLKEEMLQKKLELDSAVYATLISAVFKAGRKDDVFGLLEEMRTNGCKTDIVTYNAMIHGHCLQKDFDSALGILNEMEEKGCKPDVISYNVIIGGLCKLGKLREANELFEDMPRRKCSPDVITYRTLFDGLCDGMLFKEAAFILDEMVFKNHLPRSSSICAYSYQDVDPTPLDGNFIRLDNIVLAKQAATEFRASWLREARKLFGIQKNGVPSLEGSLVLSTLAKGSVPSSSPSGKGHAAILVDEKHFTHLPAHVARSMESVPSPGVGH